jgi:N-acetyl-alpha-D-glucosaminyl L-malate synthase BshA
MNIAIVCYPTYGGSGVVATELGKSLAKRGHKVHFITYAMPMRLDSFQENVFFHEVEMPTYPLFEFPLYTLALAGKIIDVAKYEKLDIMHVHYAIPHAMSGFLAKQVLQQKDDIKLVTTLHGTDITLVGLEPTYQPLVKFSLDESDAVTAVSNHLADKTKTLFNTSKDIEVITNFIDLDLYKRGNSECIRKRLAPNGEQLLVHTSNFRPVKRVQDTIRILAEVLPAVPNTRLLLIGDGPERTDCERLARELNVANNVTFLGKQNALPEILSAGDVFLLPSQSESFGLSALEAMSCGMPVVGSSVGGIPEVVAHGETGYVAEFGDVSRMAKYVIDLLTNKKKWKIFSDESRKRAEEKFGIDQIVPQYEELYTRLLKGTTSEMFESPVELDEEVDEE